MGNRPWDEDVLDFLAVHLQENQYDLKQTMALIANSRIYKSKSVTLDRVPDDEFVFKGPVVKRMTAEQFMDAVMHVAGTTPRGQKGPVPSFSKHTKSNENSKPSGGKPLSKWIWNKADANSIAGGVQVEFLATLSLKTPPKNDSIVITCDNEFTLFMNGKKLRNDKDWNSVELIPISRHLKTGENSIRILAANHSNTPNPAALYVTVFVNRKPVSMRWRTVSEGQESQAQAVKHQGIWSAVTPNLVAKELEASSVQNFATNDLQPRLRVSHFVSDPLMRSLGRPNREQIVTTRDDQLSTLQALDLSNGQVFADILDGGASRMLNRLETKERILEHVYAIALSRAPSEEESKLLNQLMGEKPDAQSVADLIWAVVMLPEFQHVR